MNAAIKLSVNATLAITIDKKGEKLKSELIRAVSSALRQSCISIEEFKVIWWTKAMERGEIIVESEEPLTDWDRTTIYFSQQPRIRVVPPTKDVPENVESDKAA
jgi:hypothetical protein